MRDFAFLTLILSLAGGAGAQVVGDFEACAPGPVPVGGCAPATWVTTGGMQRGIVAAKNGDGFLGSPVAGGPAPHPLVGGSTGNLVFAGITLGGTISFDWNYVSPECPNDVQYNDFLSVDIVDPASGMPLANVLYRDTFSGTYGPAVIPEPQTGVVASGFCPPSLEEAPPGAAKSLSFSVPAALVGTVGDVEFHVGNATDNSFGG